MVRFCQNPISFLKPNNCSERLPICFSHNLQASDDEFAGLSDEEKSKAKRGGKQTGRARNRRSYQELSEDDYEDEGSEEEVRMNSFKTKRTYFQSCVQRPPKLITTFRARKKRVFDPSESCE